MPDDEEKDGEGGGGGGSHQVRFVARTLDGVEVISAPITLKAGEGSSKEARLAAAFWGHGSYAPGQTAYACASAHGGDGAAVRFIVEKSAGGGWSGVANLSAKVKGEKAVAEWPVPSLPAGTKVRFRAETGINKQEALPFAVGADEGAKGEEGGGSATQKSGGGKKGSAPPPKARGGMKSPKKG